MAEVLDIGIEPDSLTVKEQITLEKLTGLTLQEMGRYMPVEDGGMGQAMPTDIVVAWVFIGAQRRDPGFTFEALQDMKLTEFREFVAGLQVGNAGAGERPAKPGRRTSDGSRSSRTGSASRRRISGV